MNITAPTVHLNGTSHRELYNGYEEAYHAVRAAQEAISNIEFNARDYYVQGDNAFTKARDHRNEQRQALAQVEEYLLQHLAALQKQQK